MRHLQTAMLTLCLALAAAACEQQENAGDRGTSPPLNSPMGARAVVAPPPTGSGTGATALTWSAPDGWVAEAPSTRMRKAQYRVPGEAGDAECIVFYFGPDQGGSPMANAERWAGQFTLADGRPGRDGMKIDNRWVGEVQVLNVEVQGTYQTGRPMQRSTSPPKPKQMLLGAVAQGPDANWFFKLTGPEATVAAQRSAFDQLIGSLRQGS